MPKPTLTIRLLGGLGNQLFIYAFGRALATRGGMNLVLDAGSGYGRDPFKREFLLDAFPGLNAAVDRRPRADLLVQAMSRLPPFIARMFGRVIVERPPWRYQQKVHAAEYRKNTYFIGYWQSVRYFEEITTCLRQELQPPPPVDPDSLRTLEEIQATRSCFVHFRSFSEENLRKKVPSIEYYRTAMGLLQERHQNVRFYIFSDDPGKAKRLFADCGGDFTVVDLPGNRGNRPALADFYLMHSCQHAIIGDSSFSWWAAWLNGSPGQQVIAPGGFAPWGDDWLPSQWRRLDLEGVEKDAFANSP